MCFLSFFLTILGDKTRGKIWSLLFNHGFSQVTQKISEGPERDCKSPEGKSLLYSILILGTQFRCKKYKKTGLTILCCTWKSSTHDIYNNTIKMFLNTNYNSLLLLASDEHLEDTCFVSLECFSIPFFDSGPKIRRISARFVFFFSLGGSPLSHSAL